jgi:hypothetical protein
LAAEWSETLLPWPVAPLPASNVRACDLGPPRFRRGFLPALAAPALLGSPLIHAFGHEQYGRAAAAVLLRDVPWVAAALLTKSCSNFDECPGRYYAAGTLGIVGLVGVVIDWTALSWEPRKAAPRVAVAPLVGKVNGAALRVTF